MASVCRALLVGVGVVDSETVCLSAPTAARAAVALNGILCMAPAAAAARRGNLPRLQKATEAMEGCMEEEEEA